MLVPFCFWFVANVEHQRVTMQTLEKRNQYFHPGNRVLLVLLRETHLSTPDILTTNQLRCMAENGEHFNAP